MSALHVSPHGEKEKVGDALTPVAQAQGEGLGGGSPSCHLGLIKGVLEEDFPQENATSICGVFEVGRSFAA